MSKQNPNQDFYKTAGRSQSDGPDRLDSKEQVDMQRFTEDQPGKDRNHPAIRRAKKK